MAKQLGLAGVAGLAVLATVGCASDRNSRGSHGDTGSAVASLGSTERRGTDGTYTFGPIAGSSMDTAAVLTERLLVRELQFNGHNRLTGVTFHIPDDSPRWQGGGPVFLSEVRIGVGGRLVSWTMAEGGTDCQLRAVIDPEGNVTFSCSGDCPPEFPICSLTQVIIEEQIHLICLCKAESDN